WSERPEPRASNIPGLGAWTRPPDRRWRITAKRNVAGVPRARGRGLERLQHGTVRIKARTNSWRLLIMRVRNWKPTKPRRHRGRPPYTVTKNMLRLAGTTPNLRPYSLVFLTCRFDSFSNTHHGYAGHK